MSLPQPELQLCTLRLYGELICRASSWPHKLTLAAFEGASGSGLAAASSLAGAASLTVDSDSALMKAHFRDGAFDFVVNTLDEALRALKNEIRQGRPIAIGLMAEPDAVLSEAAERGVAADLVVGGSGQEMVTVACPEAPVLLEGVIPSPELAQWLSEREWYAREMPAAFEDAVRQKWMRDLPALQRSVRQGPPWAWATLPSR